MSSWETVGSSNDGWEDVGGWETVSPTKRNTTFLENVGIGLKDAAIPVVKAAHLIGGGAFGALGADELRDASYKQMEETTKNMEDYWTPKDAEQNFIGKLTGTVATLPAQMLAMPFSAADTGQRMVQAGESIENAQKATLIDTAGNVAGIALPASMSGGLATRVLTGAGGNMAQDYLTRKAIQGVAETPEMQKHWENTPETLAMSGILGGGFGAIGSTPTKTKTDGDTTPTKENPYTSVAKEKAPVEYDVINDVRDQYNVSKAESEVLQKKLDQPNLPEDMRDRYLDDLNRELGIQRELGQLLGMEEIPQGRTGEAPTVVEPKAIPEPKPEFVPETDRDAVGAAVAAKDYESMPSRYVDSAITTKQNKLESLDQALQNPNLLPEHALNVQDLRDRVASELQHLQEVRQRQAMREDQTAYSKMDGYVPSWSHVKELVAAIDNGGVRGGLEMIANLKGDKSMTPYSRFLGELAQKLLDNPLIGHGKLDYQADFKGIAGFHNHTADFVIRSRAEATPAALVHEAVHNAVNKALYMFGRGDAMDPRQYRAAKNLSDLYKSILGNKDHMAKIEKSLGKDAEHVMQDVQEFVAYGMSHQHFQLLLNKIKLGEQTVWTKLTTAIKDLLNLKTNERTALDDVLRYGEKLIELSDGKADGHQGGNSLMAVKVNPQAINNKVRDGALSIFSHAFTAQIPQLVRKNPIAKKLTEGLYTVERRTEQLKREVLYGVDSFAEWSGAGKFFHKLSGSERADAVVPAMYKMDEADIVDVHNAMMDGYRKGQKYEDTIEQNKANWNDKQLNLAQVLVKAATKLWEASVRMQAHHGLDKMKMRDGWMPTQRIGDHYVVIQYHGIPIRVESYLSKAEAEHQQKFFKSKAQDYEVSYVAKKDLKDTAALGDFIEQTLKDVPVDDIRRHLDDTLTRLREESAQVGNHMMRSSILGGYVGSQVGLSKVQQGKLLREAIPRSMSSYADSIGSRDMQKTHIDFLIDHGDKLDKPTSDMLDFYVRSQTNRLIPEGSKREMIRDLSSALKSSLDGGLDSIFGFHARDKHAIDRFFGLFSNAFYTANITMKPTIWLAQPLQALMSVRTAFKEGESPRQVLYAVGDTIRMLASGKMADDPGFAKALYTASQKGNTLHPQMMNEYNSMKVGNDPNTMINKIIEGVSGHTISAAGDKASRFASFVFFYNLHKRNGLTGDTLTSKAMQDATDNMIAYGSKKMPAIYREMGMFGEQSSPLKTFAHGQMGNMIVDFKEAWQKPGAKTAAPLVMSAGVMMMLGGAISLPLIAEYELLRQLGISQGWWSGKSWPSASDTILKNAPTWVSHGALSGATGMDLDASMRYTSLFKQIADIENQSLLAFFPHLAWGANFVKGAGTLATDMLGKEHTKEEMDTAIKNTVPKGWSMGVVDAARNSDNLLTRMGKRGGGGVERSTAEAVAPWLGTRSTKEAIVSQSQINERQAAKERTAALSRAAQLYTAGHGEQAIKIMLKYEQSPTAAVKAIKQQAILEQTPALMRSVVGKGGHMSYEQMRAYQENERAKIMEKVYGND